ncbi:hypothetical protein [Aquibium oceanicum]|uniref:Uncharacterized protein n=1 Tax=Aquibium oceanicum TaxID=1670800 RepID=A0A1L3SXQ4_9HYPH|nr:hypothetical protein [Aquibium oceanicum]APH74092.1 hypothetical protein BSQ44_24030 [Aquibium oceanicum]
MQQLETTASAMDTLATRKSEAASRLKVLRDKAGTAILEGRKFDHSAIDALEHEIEALEAAEGEVTRREREASDKAIQARRKAKREELANLHSERLEALETADTLARELAGALKDVRNLTTSVHAGVRALGYPAPHTITGPYFEQRLSWLLADALSPVGMATNRFGHIEWPIHPPFHAGNWREAEEKISAHEIEPALKGE